MNKKNLRYALIWSLSASMLIAALCGVFSVRAARAESHSDTRFSLVSEPDSSIAEPTGMHPVWVIVVFETQGKRIVGITEFVFATYDACLSGADETKRKFGLHLEPKCYLRWIKTLPGTPS